MAKSKRLYLRELNINDAENFYKLNLDPEVLKYTGDKPFINIEEANNFLKEYVNQYKKYKMGRWAICLNDTNKMIGWCGLKYHPKQKYVDIGFRLFKKHWNKGYATEASLLALDYGFNTLENNKIVAHVYNENVASQKVVLKTGMTFSKNINYDKKLAKLFSISKTEYLKK
ncbi:MAG: GNAT family N-acetyltransferase [Bacteroidia bacterium]|nr:GNAT family N-acetyltransferase [Bacteroidia bacterium]